MFFLGIGRAPKALTYCIVFPLTMVFLLVSCKHQANESVSSNSGSHQKMVDLLAQVYKKVEKPGNLFASQARLAWCDSMLAATTQPEQRKQYQLAKAGILLENGDEKGAVALYELLRADMNPETPGSGPFYLAMGTAYLRLAERNNCLSGHNADACTLPFQGLGIHQDKAPGRKAIDAFTKVLTTSPKDYDALWLLNITYMALGEYPHAVPPQWLIPGLDAPGEKVRPFVSMAPDLGIGTNNRSGGSIVEDFNNDGLLDIITSAWGLQDPMKYFINKGDGTFTDVSRTSGLESITGGLNILSTDYNNDGFIDVFVLRGAWQGQTGFGEHPNSLLCNNGDGTFTDVTMEAGLLSFCPTQTATWNDFNNDGWLDLFVANENTSNTPKYPCELYMNNKNGTFTNMAPVWGLDFAAFIKGVTSGDYNNDGWPDLFFSSMNGEKLLLKNKGLQNGKLVFENATEQAGFSKEVYRTFPTWFFDYNNDGWLDIFVCNYEFNRPLSYYAGKEALAPSGDISGRPRVYHNNGDGTFTNVSEALQLNKPAFAMGANFGDIDNDGWLDMYLATGNPNFQSVVPNKLYKNINGKRFADVTSSSRTGNLQKGHAVSFGDLDNDGDQDLHVEMGGAYRGDVFPTLFYLNPGQPADNNWITLKLEGTASNKAAVGVRVAVTFTENGKKRTVYRDVNSGGSFGCSPFRREIGIGQAKSVDEVVVYWPASRETQVFSNLAANQFYTIKEGDKQVQKVDVPKIVFKHTDGRMPMCAPVL